MIRKKIILGLFGTLFALTIYAQKGQESEVSTYYLIRHAEKVISDDPNPELDSIGEQRAIKWSEIFKDISFDAVFSTDYKRTRNTAMPTAKSQALELNLYHPININYTEFLSKTKGKTILVVGHSNTIPNFVNKLIKEDKYTQIEDDRFGNLYIIEIKENIITDKLLFLN